jgi:hypothetical protein
MTGRIIPRILGLFVTPDPGPVINPPAAPVRAEFSPSEQRRDPLLERALTARETGPSGGRVFPSGRKY